MHPVGHRFAAAGVEVTEARYRAKRRQSAVVILEPIERPVPRRARDGAQQSARSATNIDERLPRCGEVDEAREPIDEQLAAAPRLAEHGIDDDLLVTAALVKQRITTVDFADLLVPRRLGELLDVTAIVANREVPAGAKRKAVRRNARQRSKLIE